jgi:hypothetical protein
LLVAPSAAVAQTVPLDQAPLATPGATGATSAGASSDGVSPAPSALTDPNRLELHGAFGKGYTIRTHDERFSLTLRARIQARVTFDASMETSRASDPFRAEFTLRRARIVLSGNAYTRALQYYIQLGLAPSDMESDLLIPLRDAYLTWTPHRYFALRAGQMKTPFSRQRVISSGSQQFVDRSIVNAELNLDRDIGVQFRSDELLDRRLGYAVGVFGGNGRNRPAFESSLLYVARLQVQPLGRFEDMDVEGDHVRTGPRLSIGVAGAFNQQTRRTQSTLGATYQLAGYDYVHGTADLMFKWAGFSLQSEAIVRVADRPATEGTVAGVARTEYSRSAVGYMVQAAYQTASHVEFGARWGHVIPLAINSVGFGAGALPMGVSPRDPGYHELHEVGGVFSYYLLGHSVKLQTDYFYLFRDSALPGNHQLRIQAQLML